MSVGDQPGRLGGRRYWYMSVGDQPGRLGGHHVLRAGRAFVLGLGILRCADCCEYTTISSQCVLITVKSKSKEGDFI